MKNILSLVIILFLAVGSMTAQDQYEIAMKKGFELWGEKKATEALAVFERVGQAETKKWRPLYHAANLLIAEAFTVENQMETEAMLEKAKTIIEKAHQRSENNSELLTLEGMLYTGFVAMNPQVYAMKYSQKIMELHDRAIEINPENPRAHANRIEFEMGTARFFGKDLKPFCDRLIKVLPKFETQDLSIPFNPRYGKERAESIIKNCGN